MALLNLNLGPRDGLRLKFDNDGHCFWFVILFSSSCKIFCIIDHQGFSYDDGFLLFISFALVSEAYEAFPYQSYLIMK